MHLLYLIINAMPNAESSKYFPRIHPVELYIRNKLCELKQTSQGQIQYISTVPMKQKKMNLNNKCHSLQGVNK